MKYIIVSGRVQGVGFRQFAKSNAGNLNIRGWVRNLPDRDVEIMAEGESENLNKFIELCKIGPFMAEVKDVKIDEVEDMDFETFEIEKD